MHRDERHRLDRSGQAGLSGSSLTARRFDFPLVAGLHLTPSTLLRAGADRHKPSIHESEFFPAAQTTLPMVTLRASTAVTLLAMALVLPLRFAHAAVPDYKLGDVAQEDVYTPVPLLVVNPEATETLKQKVAQQAPFIVRWASQSAAEAETELRASIADAREKFLTAFRRALSGRAPAEADLNSPLFTGTLQQLARESAKDLPLDKLAPLWARAVSDEPVVASLLQPVREVMAQPIVGSKTENPVPTDQSVWLIPVKNVNATPTVQEMEHTGQAVSPGKIVGLWRARRVVETYFPLGEEQSGRFASSFVRPNAYPDPMLTTILRAKRLEGVTVNDTYDAAQVIVHQGQTIDHKALGALAAMREKSLIGTLQTKLEQEQSVAGQLTMQTKWIAAGLVGIGLGLFLIFWRLRVRPSGALVAIPSAPTLTGADQKALPGDAGEDTWRTRALEAEVKADRAHEAIRTGALGWMREKIFQSLFTQRAALLSAQQKAEAEMRELEQRLEQLHTPLQERINAYEKRIEELEQDLAAKGEENQELIGARISVAKQQLNVEREHGRFGTN